MQIIAALYLLPVEVVGQDRSAGSPLETVSGIGVHLERTTGLPQDNWIASSDERIQNEILLIIQNENKIFKKLTEEI